MRRILAILATLGTLAAGTVFTLGAIAAEGALHPARLPVAQVCPCFSHARCESVAVAGADRTTQQAWYYTPDAPSNKAILLLHGVGGNRQDMLGLAVFFLREGYAVLAPDLRGHGTSGGFATYGVLEADDIRAWVDWLRNDRRTPRIYGFGASLGAAVLLASLRQESRFQAVVAESAYSDFPSIARERIARALPAGTQWIVRPFVASGIAWVRLHDSVDLDKASAADGLRATAVPVFLIHGLADDKTSPDNSRQLAALRPSILLWLVPGSGHADAWRTAGTEFESRVTSFLGSY